MLGRNKIQLKTAEQIRQMRRAGLVVADIHAALREAVRPGMTTAELDTVCAATIEAAGAKSNFLGYYGFPATVCVSVNDEVVHGIPGERVLEKGDLVTFDCGAYVTDDSGTQWHGDAAFTTVVGGHYRDETDRILDTATKDALWAAIAAVARAAAGETTGRAACLNAIGDAVEEVVDDVATKTGLQLRPVMVLAIEPMLTAGSNQTEVLADDWTVVTQDGSHAAQWEHTVAIVPGGVWVLTAPDGGVEGLAEFGLEPRPLA